MPTKYEAAIAREIIASFGAKPGLLVQILNAFVDRYTYIYKRDGNPADRPCGARLSTLARISSANPLSKV